MALQKKILALFVILIGGFFYFYSSSSKHSFPLVAITQIIEHPALDEERMILEKSLEKQGVKDKQSVQFLYENAQGSIATSTQIINRFLSKKPKVIVAISTPSAQSAIEACLRHKIPLVFSSVTDPLGAKLVKSLVKRQEDVTGVSDHLDPLLQIKMILTFFPKLKILGALYNPGEANSVKAIEELNHAAQTLGVALVLSGVSKASEISAAVLNLASKKVDAIYAPADNTVVAAMPSVVKIADSQKIPVFAADDGSVKMGALAALCQSRTLMGKKLAEIVGRILKGEKARNIAVSNDTPPQLYINRKTFKQANLQQLPKDLVKGAHWID